LEEQAFLYTIHQMRATTFDKLEAVPVDPFKLPGLAADLRGKAMRYEGLYEKSWRRSLPGDNESGLDEIFIGSFEGIKKRCIFFAVESNPAWDDIHPGEKVTLAGRFFKVFADDATGQSGPLLVGHLLQRTPVPPFVDDGDEILAKVRDQSDFPKDRPNAFVLDGDGYYYLLHKILDEDRRKLEPPVDAYVSIETMFNNPASIRGKRVRLRGKIANSFKWKKLPLPNRIGRGGIYEGQIAIRHYHEDLIFTINFFERPAAFARAKVIFEGYFLQRWAYKQQDKENLAVVTPFLTGQKVTILQEP